MVQDTHHFHAINSEPNISIHVKFAVAAELCLPGITSNVSDVEILPDNR